MGLATAQLLTAEGARVIIASCSRDKLDKALHVIGGNAEARTLDFSKEDAVREFFSALGAFDHLVLMGAGLPAWGKLSEIQSPSRAHLRRSSGDIFCVPNMVLRSSAREVQSSSRSAELPARQFQERQVLRL